MVDTQPIRVEWPSNSPMPRKKDGRVLSRDNDRWVLECSGSTTPHKHPQDDGSLLCHQGFCQGGSANLNLAAHRQYFSGSPHQQIGGTKSPQLTSQVKDLWERCLQKQITVTAQHLPCLENVTTDYLSRHLTDRTDWMLDGSQYLSMSGQDLGPIAG